MSVKLASMRMEGLLGEFQKTRDPMKWAHDACTMSRAVHVEVWRFCPAQGYVDGTVLRVLEAARDKLVELRTRKDVDEAKIGKYLNNVERRIVNIKQNYLHGKLSAFAPDSRLSEPRAKAM